MNLISSIKYVRAVVPHRLLAAALVFLFLSCQEQQPSSIDREALVARHKVYINAFDSLGALSVGNGEFAFTVGITGLQTFPEKYQNGMSLGTQSQWGWHSFPNPERFTLNDIAKEYDAGTDGKVPYAARYNEGRKGAASEWLRQNPHRLHLGLLGLVLLKENGEEVQLEDIQQPEQTLDLWTGKVESTYQVEGVPVKIELYAHQQKDQLSVRIHSPLISKKRLKLSMRFPYGAGCHVCPGYDWEHPEKHRTVLASEGEQSALLQRILDSTTYYVGVNWQEKGKLEQLEPHHFELIPGEDAETFEFSVLFSPGKPEEALPGFTATEESSREEFLEFWTGGGAIDFSACTDPRAKELERRVVLSQYLTKIQCTGSLPPQETGLTMNSWYGKYHLEMYWWHAAHFALWDRAHLVAESMDWYKKIMDKAQATASWQGYEGARWPKMTGPEGNESPSNVGPFLVWQQPHPIYMAELFYRRHPNKETLEKYKELVFQTADFMASFARYKEEDQKYHLSPPLIPAQELFNALTTEDPPFELAYWHYALSVAQQWRKRLGLPEDEEWQEVIDKLTPMPVKDRLYLPDANSPMAYQDKEYRRDHPVVTGAYGILPWSPRIDTVVMARTFDEIMRQWNWETTWGWDYPMLAMSAARLGKPQQAVNALLMDAPKNTYLVNGHNYQDKRLRLYLPGNGGLLTAVAMMAAGWDGAAGNTPGFPDDGTWEVRWEGLKRMP